MWNDQLQRDYWTAVSSGNYAHVEIRNGKGNILGTLIRGHSIDYVLAKVAPRKWMIVSLAYGEKSFIGYAASMRQGAHDAYINHIAG